MTTRAPAPMQTRMPSQAAAGSVLQRHCACGQHTMAGEPCTTCKANLDKAQDSRISVNHPRDRHEQDANLAAAMVLQSGARGTRTLEHATVRSMLQRNQSSPSAHSEVRGPVASEIESLNGKGVGLDASTRGFMESRFQYDFSPVRIHTGERAHQLAQAVDSLAFTVGRNIVFGNGQYAPGTVAGRFVLAHELAHVVQQGNRPAGLQLFRLSPALCSSDCIAPDSPGAGAATSWNLTIAVDREQQGLGRLLSGQVGHTWVKLTNDAHRKYSYGFWPQVGFNRKKPLSSVAGCVHHPDTAHEPPNATGYLEKKYTVNHADFQNALSHAQSVCAAMPNYNLASYNCTSFAIDVAKAANVSPPSSTTLAVHNPNALYEGIEKDRPEGHPGLGALLGGLGGAALGAGIGSAGGLGGAIAGGLLGGLAGAVGGALIGDVT